MRKGDEILAIEIAGNRNAFPDFLRTEITHHCRHAPDVVAVAVGDEKPVEAANAECPESRRYHSPADIERPRRSSGVDKQRSVASRLKDHGLALTDVEQCHPDARTTRLHRFDAWRAGDHRKAHRRSG